MIIDLNEKKNQRLVIPIMPTLIRNTDIMLESKGMHFLLSYISWRDNCSQHEALQIVCDELLQCDIEDKNIQEILDPIKGSGVWNKEYSEYESIVEHIMGHIYISSNDGDIIGNTKDFDWEDKLCIAGVFVTLLNKEWHCPDNKDNLILNGQNNMAKVCGISVKSFKNYYDWLIKNGLIVNMKSRDIRNHYKTRMFTARTVFKNDLKKYVEQFNRENRYETV